MSIVFHTETFTNILTFNYDYVLSHAHKETTDSLELKDTAIKFTSVNAERQQFFGSF